MESIDERIRKALSSEDRAFLGAVGCRAARCIGDVAATFRGHTALAERSGLGLRVLCYCWPSAVVLRLAVRRTSQICEACSCGARAPCLSALGARADQAVVLDGVAEESPSCREIKRVELQVASLTAAMRSGKAQ